MSNKIFIGNLDFGMTDRDLRELLSEVGEVADVHMPTDRETGRPRGFAFVRFATEEQAAQAVETMNGREVSGRTLRLDIAEDRLKALPFTRLCVTCQAEQEREAKQQRRMDDDRGYRRFAVGETDEEVG